MKTTPFKYFEHVIDRKNGVLLIVEANACDLKNSAVTVRVFAHDRSEFEFDSTIDCSLFHDPNIWEEVTYEYALSKRQCNASWERMKRWKSQ